MVWSAGEDDKQVENSHSKWLVDSLVNSLTPTEICTLHVITDRLLQCTPADRSPTTVAIAEGCDRLAAVCTYCVTCQRTLLGDRTPPFVRTIHTNQYRLSAVSYCFNGHHSATNSLFDLRWCFLSNAFNSFPLVTHNKISTVHHCQYFAYEPQISRIGLLNHGVC